LIGRTRLHAHKLTLAVVLRRFFDMRNRITPPIAVIAIVIPNMSDQINSDVGLTSNWKYAM